MVSMLTKHSKSILSTEPKLHKKSVQSEPHCKNKLVALVNCRQTGETVALEVCFDVED